MQKQGQQGQYQGQQGKQGQQGQQGQNKRIFLVCGATGAQGSSVCKALVKSGKYQVRGICRNINNEQANELRQLGVELYQCDLNKPDQLKSAMKGAEFVFGVTNWWDKESREREYEIGKRLVDCAKENNVKLFIWSGLPNTEHLSGGKCNVPMFTQKGRIAEYARQNLPTCVVTCAFYYQNFSSGFLHQKRESDGTIVFTLPKVSALPALDICDLGEVVKNIANEDPKEMNGKNIPLAGDSMPMEKYLEQIQESCGCKVKLNAVSFKDYANLNFDGAKALATLFEWTDTYGYFGTESDLTLGRSLGQLKNFKQFLQTNKFNPK